MCCFAGPVSADVSTYSYSRQYVELLGEYKNGNITLDEFNEAYSSLSNEYATEHTKQVTATITGDLNDLVSIYGSESVNDMLDDVLNPYATTTTTSTTDTKGYGCLVVSVRTKYNNYYEKAYCEYAVLSADNIVAVYGDGYIEQYDVKTGNLVNTIPIYSNGGSPSYGGTFVDNADYRREVYGDLRYGDGSSAPTNDTFVEKPTYDFSNATDKDLENIFNNLNETLKRENPDLTTMEGLLESIYYRLGSLDSDNDNALLSQVLVAIQSLQGTDNSELLAILNEIKEELTNGTTGDNSDLAEKLEKMITVDDFVIDEEAYKNHSEVLKLRLQEKFIFANQLKDFVLYSVNAYSNSSEKPEIVVERNGNSYSMDFSIYDNYIDEFRFLLAAFIYLSYAYHTYRKIPSYINGGDNE